MGKIDFWQNRLNDLRKVDRSKLSDEELEDLGMELHEAEANLNYAWQDDELDSLGLPHPWGY